MNEEEYNRRLSMIGNLNINAKKNLDTFAAMNPEQW